MTDFEWTRRRFLWTAGIASAVGLVGPARGRSAADGGPLAADGSPSPESTSTSNGRRQKIILDVDTGTDDAVALMFGALHPDLELIAATTVNGNVPIENCTENSLRVFDYIGADVPVYQGLASPFFRDDFPRPRKQSEPSAFHGKYLDLPPATSKRQAQGAVDFLIETYSRPESREIILVPVGPLSNIAMALKQAPEIVANIPEIMIMGGAHEMGNVTASAEFNVWADPEAARVVLASGVEKITMVALDATTRALVSLDDAKRLRELGTPAGEAAARFVEKRVEGYLSFDPDARAAAPVHDALAVAAIVNPKVISTRHAFVDVETESGLTVGRTVVDWRARSRESANVHFALGADEPLFVEMLLETMGRTP